MKITIITPTLNAGQTLSHCLDSVVAQRVAVEHILVDGGSTDGTLAIAQSYGKHLAQVVSEPDAGVYDAMNKGIALATGDVVGILNANDFYPSPSVLQRVLSCFEDSAVDASYGDMRYVAAADTGRTVRVWRAGEFDPAKFYWGWMPPHPTFFVRRWVYRRFGCFRLDMGTAADYEIMLRFLLKHGVKVVYVPEVLVHMRTGGMSNASLINRWRANRMDRKAWDVNGLRPYPWTLFFKVLRKLGQWVVR